MDEAQVREQLSQIFRDVFDDETIQLRDDMTASDIDGWDSLTHINLVVAAEQAFGIHFATGEVNKLPNVGAFLQLIRQKAGKA